MSLAAKNMSPKKGYIEMGGYFYLGTHIKCTGTVTFILLTLYNSVLKMHIIV